MVQGNLTRDHKLDYDYPHDHSHCCHRHPHHHHHHDDVQETMVLDGSDRRRMEEFGKKHLLLLGSMDRHGQSHDAEDDNDDYDDDDLDGKWNDFGDYSLDFGKYFDKIESVVGTKL